MFIIALFLVVNKLFVYFTAIELYSF